MIFIIDFFSPGVTITELQKRGGLGPEAYAAVSSQNLAAVGLSGVMCGAC